MEKTSTRPVVEGEVTEGQDRLLQAMPELADCRYPQVYDQIPVSNYIDPERYEAELKAVWRSVPVIAAPSVLLAEPKSVFQVTIAGMPVLLTRNKDGEIRAFANVCTHRGMKLCTSKKAEKVPRLICPYHAWTFDLDGKLIGLPRAEIFPGLDKSKLGLRALPVREAGGLIWVGLDPDKEPDFSTVEGELADDLNSMRFGKTHLYDHVSFSVKANWKLVMDSMLDSYHVLRLHKNSLAQFSNDSENQIDRIGLHIRNAAHRSRFERKLISPNHEDLRKIMIFSYTPFPNGIIVVSPGYISLGVVRPIAVDECVVDYYMLAHKAPETEQDEDRLKRSLDLMTQVFANEDYWAAAMCHEGLSSGVISEVQLGGMEIQIRMFQDAVSECLAKAAAV